MGKTKRCLLDLLLAVCCVGLGFLLPWAFQWVNNGVQVLLLLRAMLLGRVFCGLLEAFVFAPGYTWAQWLRESFVICLPGIVLQLAAIPLITLALRRCKIAETP